MIIYEIQSLKELWVAQASFSLHYKINTFINKQLRFLLVIIKKWQPALKRKTTVQVVNSAVGTAFKKNLTTIVVVFTVFMIMKVA